MQDTAIVEMFTSRNESAIAESQRKYGAYLKQIAYNVLGAGSTQDSEEIANDTYLSAWNSIPPHKPEQLSTYLGKIARQIAIDSFRKRTSQKRLGSQYALSLSELADCIPASADFSPERAAESRLLREKINEWLATLEVTTRKIFVARYFFHDSLREIAPRYDMSESKVKSMMFRTRNDLKAFLEKEGFTI